MACTNVSPTHNCVLFDGIPNQHVLKNLE